MNAPAPSSSGPRVLVLLATYNGAPWLEEQLRTLAGQQGVRVGIVASDDSSTDATPTILRAWADRGALELLPPAGRRLGSANRNFLRLIREAPLGDADLVALADQDDVWLPGKLARAADCLQRTGASAYSSDVTAFWPDGTRKQVRKSQPQRPLDHLFGSPGPGCTYVMPRAAFERLRAWVVERFDELQDLWVHDWPIYAFVRSHGMRWHIDDQALMLYRQHGHNEFGANAGWRAAWRRWQKLRSGAFRQEVLTIAAAVGDRSRASEALRRLRWTDRLWLVAHSRDFRRRALDSAVLAATFLLMSPGDRRGGR